MLKEFKEFAMKGNLIDMAVAFVMGAAFSKWVSSFIDGMVMPVIGKLTTGVDFKAAKYVLTAEQMDMNGQLLSPEVAIHYGSFITATIDFLLVAFVMFLLVKASNKLKRQEEPKEEAAPSLSLEQQLLTEIRDNLKNT